MEDEFVGSRPLPVIYPNQKVIEAYRLHLLECAMDIETEVHYIKTYHLTFTIVIFTIM